jgi:hypothetical protein
VSVQVSSDTFLDAYARYREFFSLGQIRFSFPKERQDLVPSPLYHSLEGSEYIHVDWLLSHPKTELLCFECMQNKNEIVELAHDRTTFSHSAHFFPIFGKDGKTAWANVMKYCCSRYATPYLIFCTCVLRSIIVSYNYEQGKSLRNWVHTQRRSPAKNTIRLDRKYHLGKIGFAWRVEIAVCGKLIGLPPAFLATTRNGARYIKPG